MRQQATRELYSYWNGLRRQRAAPDRAEIDPAAIRSVLSDTFMIEADRDALYPLRLSGARVNALWARDLKGRSFLDLWGDDRTCLAGRPPVDLEMLLLPLRHHGRTHARVLGSLSAAQNPEWVGLIPIERVELRSLRIISSGRAPVELPVASRSSQAIDRRMKIRPQFRLIQGGRC